MKNLSLLFCIVGGIGIGFGFGVYSSDVKYQSSVDYYLESNKEISEVSRGWQYAAEHYGGVCKWLLKGKPIYGTINMDSQTTLSDCLVVSGSAGATIRVMEGAEQVIITNNIFQGIDMEWICSQKAVDPNAVMKE